MPLYLNYQAVFISAYIILSLILLFNLLKLKDKSKLTWLVIFLFMGLTLYFITLFIYTILPEAAQFWFRPSQYISFQVSLVLILKFAYTFPQPWQHQRVEAKVVIGLSILATLVAAALFGYQLHVNSSTSISADHPQPPNPMSAYLFASLAVIIGLSWAILVLLRRTLQLSEEETTNRSLVGKLLKPKGKPARTSRAFALLLATPFGTILFIFLRHLGIFSDAIVDFIILVAIMLFYFTIMMLYLNYAPESSTFMIKLVGASLIVVLALLGTVGQVFQPLWKKAYQYANLINQEQTIRFQPTQSGMEVLQLPTRFDSQWEQGQKLVPEDGENITLDLEFAFPFRGKHWKRIHIHKDGLVTFDSPLYKEAFWANRHIGIAPMWLDLNVDTDANENTSKNEKTKNGIFHKNEPGSGKLTITWANMVEKETGVPRTLQLVLSRDGSIEFNYRNIRGCRPKLAGIFSGNGLSEAARIHFSQDLPFSISAVAAAPTVFENFFTDYRRYIHHRMLPLAIMLVLAASIILLVFPFFFKSVLVKPLQSLLEGVKAVKHGRWSGAVPVRYNDEIGFLTASFNHMVQSLDEAKKGWHEADKAKDKLLALNQSILETAAEGILTLNPEGKILSFNDAAEDMFRYPREEIIGKPDHILLHQPDPDQPMGFLGHYMASGKQKPLGVEYEFMGKQKQGELFPLEFAVSATNHMGADIEGAEIFTVVLHDLTEHKRWAEEKIKLEGELHQAQKLETIGTLAGGIAHDFNNILTPLIGYTEMAIEDIPEDNPVHKYLKNILSSSYRAKELVKQILTFSRKSEQMFEMVDIYSVIKNTISLLRASTPSSIVFDLDLNPDSGTVFGDRTQLGQVLINLCTNAAHAMQPEGGTLYIALDCVVIDEKTAKQHPKLKQDTYAVLRVTDTGKGMDRETLTHIFEPFFTTKDVGEGTGLGLSVVHGIVDRHGGAVMVDSQPGKGTTIKVYFPSMPAKDIEEIIQLEKKKSKREKKGDILLVDDEEMIVNMYKEWLERVGYSVTAETSSLKTLEIFRERAESFDIVIADYTMPGLSGLQLAEEILAIRPDIPFILYTGNISDVSANTLKQSGIKKLLIKPVNITTLNRSIQELLEPVKL
ncbi:MAG: response regulator [Candidatus Aminicenantes bacterium]|nr:response regulator [Candidatus Aminicenantes bacterium]NIM77553.1 response regulator [Candidatus Aminicenantes bacterium]NIN16874.1 response regulator [Candidatus Aminicenantes bacterium]NIN40762.1 response regulator [Candidatus Aminicenantes bacterium]NIN83571.1 response regulator [Candidatus Aminicenantes bacterium]